MTENALPPTPAPAPMPEPDRQGSAGPGDARRSGRGLGRTALILVLVASIGGILAAATIGGSMGPVEAAHGGMFRDTPGWYRATVYALGGSFALWSVLGIGGLVAGIVAIVRDAHRGLAIAAVVISVLAPGLVFAVFIAVALMSTAMVL